MGQIVCVGGLMVLGACVISWQQNKELIQIQMILALGLILILEVSIVSAATFSTITDTIAISSPGQQYTAVDISGVNTGNTIRVEFEVTNDDFSSTFVAVSTSGAVDISRYNNSYSLFGKGPSDLKDMDVLGLRLGRKQYIELPKVAAQDLLYYTVWNLDPSSGSPNRRRKEVTFTLDIFDQGTSTFCLCDISTHGTSDSGGGCGTCSCDSGYGGTSCQRKIVTVESQENVSQNLTGPGQIYFELDEEEEIDLKVSSSDGYVEVYFQFIEYDDQFAAYTNVAIGTNAVASFSLGGSGSLTLSATPNGKKSSVTVAMFDNLRSSTVTVFYEGSSSTNLLVIILGILGGILLIVIIIAGVYIIRRTQNSPSQVEVDGERPLPSQIHVLDMNEIDKFFPEVELRLLKNDSEATQLNLAEPVELDCVICLSPILPEEMVRAGYCKHIFHSGCLKSWFKKQKNCPYCREDFSRKNVIKKYKELVRDNDNKILKGLHLVKAIMDRPIVKVEELSQD